MSTQSLEFKSGLDDSKFQAGLKNMERGAQKSTSKISGFMKGLGIAAAAKAAVDAGKAVVNFSGDLSDLSAAAQLDVETFQQLSGVFAQSGTSMETFAKGMGAINSAFESAKTELGPAREALDGLGISFEAISKSRGEERLYLIADAYAAAADKGAAFERVTELVGARNKKMVAAMVVGGAEIRKMGSQIEFVSEAQLTKVDQLGDAATRLKIKALAGGAAVAGAIMGAGNSASFSKGASRPSIDDPREIQRVKTEAERLKKIREQQLEAQKEGLKVAIETGEANVKAAESARDAARDALIAALSGQRAQRPSATERRVARMMAQSESPALRKAGLGETTGLKSGGLGGPDALKTGGLGLDVQTSFRSTRSGSGKALKAFQDAQAKNKAAEEKQKEMVEALKAIQKGITGE